MEARYEKEPLLRGTPELVDHISVSGDLGISRDGDIDEFQTLHHSISAVELISIFTELGKWKCVRELYQFLYSHVQPERFLKLIHSVRYLVI